MLKSGITAKSYDFTGLTLGNTYQFKIESRNQIGYSSFSNEISVLTTLKENMLVINTPDATNITTVVVNTPAVTPIETAEPYINVTQLDIEAFAYYLTAPNAIIKKPLLG